jgi:hypothetical protein
VCVCRHMGYSTAREMAGNTGVETDTSSRVNQMMSLNSLAVCVCARYKIAAAAAAHVCCWWPTLHSSTLTHFMTASARLAP